MTAIIVGLTGEKWAGKTLFSSVIEKTFSPENVLLIRSGNILGRKLKKMGCEDTDENKQTMYLRLRRILGNNFLSKEIEKVICENKEKYLWIVWDGVRKPWDVDALERCGGILISIECTEEKRVLNWGTRREKSGEGRMTLQQFQTISARETEADIKEISKRAKYVIVNMGSKKRMTQWSKKCILEIEERFRKTLS